MRAGADSTGAVRRGRRAASVAGAGVLLLLLVLAIQARGGTFDRELTVHADEPAHYVTGLMVRDYLASAFPSHPLRYAETYYAHYPKVAIGHWPPVFYAVQAGWTLVLPASATSVLVGMSVLTALLATTIFAACLRLGPVPSAFAALLFTGLPLVQAQAGVIMADMLVALLALWATLALSRYVAEPSWGRSVAFILLASAAILTKGTAIALALVPPLTWLLLPGRRHLARRLDVWAMPVGVALLCAPWYLIAAAAAAEPVTDEVAALGLHNVGTKATQLYTHAGPVLLCAALIGLWAARARRDDTTTGAAAGGAPGTTAPAGVTATVPAGPSGLSVPTAPRAGTAVADPTWATLAALVAGQAIFQVTVGAADGVRHLLQVLAPLVMLAAAGITPLAIMLAGWLRRRLPAGASARVPAPRAMEGLVAAGALALVLIPRPANVSAFEVPRQGYARIAATIAEDPTLTHAVVLVSSDSIGEGATVAEMAIRDRRPQHVVLRGSKVLSSSSWMGDNYHALFRSATELQDYLERARVALVVMDDTAGISDTPDRHQLRAALADETQWAASVPAPAGVQLFRRRGALPATPGRAPLEIGMPHSWERDIPLPR
ncbi:MAG: ArnT family glycosyltransferase [Vicinamibacterales bacterium]